MQDIIIIAYQQKIHLLQIQPLKKKQTRGRKRKSKQVTDN